MNIQQSTMVDQRRKSRGHLQGRNQPRPGRTRLVVGIVLMCVGLVGVVAGSIGIGVLQHRSTDGYYLTGQQILQTDGYAIVGSAETDDFSAPFVNTETIIGRLRVTGERTGLENSELFVGIGPAAQVARYLENVEYSVVSDLGRPATAVSTSADGRAPATPPAGQTFWTSSATGTGLLVIDTDVPASDWAVVVMNADSSRGLQAQLSVGATFPVVIAATWLAFLAGTALLAGGLASAVAGTRAERRARFRA